MRAVHRMCKSKPTCAGTHYSRPIVLLQLMALPEDKQLETLLDYMVAQASEAASIEDLSPDQPLLELGLDSLRAAQFAVQVLILLHAPCASTSRLGFM